jgi:hypothetical protein
MFRPLLGHHQVSVSVKVLKLYPIWIHIMDPELTSYLSRYQVTRNNILYNITLVTKTLRFMYY